MAQDDVGATPSFILPLSCGAAADCRVLNYPDTGPADGQGVDTACLSRTYEGHKGTDFALPDEAAMKKGVPVLAAAQGTVTRVRDGEEDRWPTPADLEKTKADKKECGNAVLIDHGDGWQTMYCHLKKGSITVARGQAVKAGEKIAQVGLSGMTEFPHLHFGVIHQDKVMDPFTGAALDLPCGQAGAPLWDKSANLRYEPVVISAMGFDIAPPTLHTLDRKRNERTALRADADAVLFHAVLWGVREGDVVTLKLKDPQGRILAENTVTQDRNRARQLYYIGRKIPETAPLASGPYTGEVSVTRTEKDGARKLYADKKTLSVQ